MAVQNSGNLNTIPFVRGKDPRTKTVTFAQNAQRSGDVEQYTLLSKVLASGYYTTFTDETATDGTQWPRAISCYAATEAQVQAADVEDFEVYYLDIVFDSGQLTIENSKTLDTEITSPAGIDMTVRDYLETLGIVAVTTTAIDGYENA